MEATASKAAATASGASIRKLYSNLCTMAKGEPTPFGRFPARAGPLTGRSLRVASGPFRLAAYLAIALLRAGRDTLPEVPRHPPAGGPPLHEESLPYEPSSSSLHARETIVAIIDAGGVVGL